MLYEFTTYTAQLFPQRLPPIIDVSGHDLKTNSLANKSPHR